MEGFDSQDRSAPQPPRPSIATVASLLAVTALIFSYLIGYALANALVAAEVISPWTAGHDPRLKWFAVTFIVLISSFLTIGAAVRTTARRQMRRMEAMEIEADSPLSA